MSMDKPWNDVADQLRPAQPDLDLLDEEYDVMTDSRALGSADLATEPGSVIEADPADVADQHRVVPLPDDQPWP